MVLVYILTERGYIDGIHVTIYSIHGSYGKGNETWGKCHGKCHGKCWSTWNGVLDIFCGRGDEHPHTSWEFNHQLDIHPLARGFSCFHLGSVTVVFFLPGSWDDVIGNTRKTRGSQGFESWSFAHLRNGYLKICVVCQSWVSEFPKLKTQYWDSPIYSPFLGRTLKSSQSVFFEWPRRLAMMAGPKERAGLMEQPVTSDPPVIVRMVYSVYHINDPPMGEPNIIAGCNHILSNTSPMQQSCSHYNTYFPNSQLLSVITSLKVITCLVSLPHVTTSLINSSLP